MMFEVNIYIETSMKGPGTRKGWYAAVLEFIKNGKSITREDFAFEKETTYHKSVLCALTKSLKMVYNNRVTFTAMGTALARRLKRTGKWCEPGRNTPLQITPE